MVKFLHLDALQQLSEESRVAVYTGAIMAVGALIGASYVVLAIVSR